jgi:zinc transport system substrate-binding protein
MKMASAVKGLLCDLNPQDGKMYESNYDSLMSVIEGVDRLAREMFSEDAGSSFMIYHPNLAYLARDYGLEEISVEFEGKEPPPSRLKELIDLARERKIKTIFVQKEYDTKNAKAIAGEIGADLEIIDPLSADWYRSTVDIITALHNSIEKSKN